MQVWVALTLAQSQSPFGHRVLQRLPLHPQKKQEALPRLTAETEGGTRGWAAVPRSAHLAMRVKFFSLKAFMFIS